MTIGAMNPSAVTWTTARGGFRRGRPSEARDPRAGSARDEGQEKQARDEMRDDEAERRGELSRQTRNHPGFPPPTWGRS